MALIDTIRRSVDGGRAKLDALGLRLYTVTVRTVDWSESVNVAGAVASAPTDLVLDPRPRVRKLGPGDDSWLGGGLVTEAGGKATASEYEVGPIALPYDAGAGGYSADDLLPAPSASRQVYWILEGPDLQAGGETFGVVRLWNVSLSSVMVHLQREGRP
jgi:hypothetical protein